MVSAINDVTKSGMASVRAAFARVNIIWACKLNDMTPSCPSGLEISLSRKYSVKIFDKCETLQSRLISDICSLRGGFFETVIATSDCQLNISL